MCSCDYDAPALYRERVLRSRKVRRCCECRCNIGIGDFYTNVFGVWDGEPDTYAMCDTCSTVKSLASDVFECLCPAFGNLHHDIEAAAWEDNDPRIQAIYWGRASEMEAA